MVDWNTPALSDTFANFLSYLKTRDESLAKMDFDSDSNYPTNTIKWDAAASRFEIYNGSEWVALESTKYMINVDQLDGKDEDDFVASSHAGAGADAHALATDSVHGFLSSTAFTTIGNLGTSSTKDTGVANGNVPLMDATGYPAADGSQVTGITGKFLGIDSDDTAGTKTWTKPAGTAQVYVVCVGAGGGGGGSSSTNGGSGGGGGGWGQSTLIDVSAIDEIEYSIGTGGAGGAAGAAGADGTETRFGKSAVILYSQGAGGAGGEENGGDVGTGGAATGTVVNKGVTGSTGTLGGGQGGGGGGAPGRGAGGTHATQQSEDGPDGIQGAGGGGAGKGSKAGGAGGAGWIEIYKYS